MVLPYMVTQGSRLPDTDVVVISTGATVLRKEEARVCRDLCLSPVVDIALGHFTQVITNHRCPHSSTERHGLLPSPRTWVDLYN